MPNARRRAGVVLFALGLLALLAGCAPMTVDDPLGYSETGKASWYGTQFHGRRTASGEIYDMYDYTAAHKRLPFGTLVQVENLTNHRQVVVRINDRGPFVRGRIIDVSYTAAQELGMIQSGTARVRLKVLPVAPLPSEYMVPEEQAARLADLDL